MLFSASIIGVACAVSCIVGLLAGYLASKKISSMRKAEINEQTKWFEHGGLNGPR